jgi:pectate lyase
MQLYLAETIGEQAEDFARDAADHLEAHARHAYDAQANHFRPMWADGTDVTGLKNPRTGYGQGNRGDVYSPSRATTEHLAAYLRAARLTQRPLLWQTARDMARGFGLGDIGAQPGQKVELCAESPTADPELIFAVLELYQITPQTQVIDTARRLADRMIETRFHHGFFLPSPAHRYANFNCETPLAVLAVEAAIRGEPELVPAHVGGRGFIHGRFDGRGRTTDHTAIWAVRRN